MVIVKSELAKGPKLERIIIIIIFIIIVIIQFISCLLDMPTEQPNGQ
jgi:hypothetical protein